MAHHNPNSSPSQLAWIPGFEGLYACTDRGCVLSYQLSSVAELNGHTTDSGHLSVKLYKDGNCESWFVHRIVLTVFNRPAESGEICRHLNGEPKDNRIENLKWGTHTENAQDRLRHGTQGMQKISEDDAVEVRKQFAKGVGVHALANEYGIGGHAIRCIVKGRTWSHVGGPVHQEDGRIEMGDDEVRSIRESYQSENVSYDDLAKRHDLDVGQIGRIIRGETRKQAGGPTSTNNQPLGSDLGKSKLGERQVLQIRELYDSENVNYEELGERYGVNHRTVGSIVRGETWQHVGGPTKG